MFKRLFDIIFSLLLIFVFLIPILIISVLIFVSSNYKIFYISERFGKDRKLFYMFKFKTMKDDTPNVATHLLADAKKYMLPTGNFLRKSSLDELPQLFNVLFGNMTFIGPRPALFNQHDLIKLRQKHGLEKLKPGLTGWAQINGRDNIDLRIKVELEKYYYENKSFFFDIKILIFTILKIFKPKDITH